MEIFLGVCSAVAIFLFRESYLKSQQQKEIAARLSSYIHHWKTKLIKNDGLFSISYIGIKWQTESSKKMRAGAKSSELLKLDEEFEEKLTQLFTTLDSKSEEIDKSVKEALEKLEKSPELKNEFIFQLNNYKSSLIDGKMFISDQDAAKLGQGYSYVCVSLKSHLVSLIENGIFFTLSFNSKEIVYDDYKYMLELIIKDWVYASKDMEFLSDAITKFTK